MKKLFVLLFLGLFLFSFVSAIDVDSQIENVENKLDSVDDFVNSNEKDVVAKDYLKKEWGQLVGSDDFANRYPFLKPILFLFEQYKKVSPTTDAILYYLVRFVPTLFLGFVLALMIWGMILKYSHLIYEALRDFSSFSNQTSAIIYTGILVISFVLKIIQSVTVALTGLIISTISSLMNTWWGQLITILVVIIVFMLMTIFSKKVKVLLRWKRLQDAKQNILDSSEEGKHQVERLRKTADIINDSLK